MSIVVYKLYLIFIGVQMSAQLGVLCLVITATTTAGLYSNPLNGLTKAKYKMML